MPDREINELPAAATLTGAEILHIVQGGNSRKVALSAVAKLEKISRVAQTANFNLTNDHLAGEVLLNVNAAAAVTITVPAGLTGTEEVTIVQQGAGQVTFAAALGVNIRSADAKLKTRVQYSSVSLVPTGTADEYYLIGDLAA